MPVTMTSTATSAPFAARVASLLDVPLAEVERRVFPDGETYLRLPLSDRSGFIGHTVILLGATESQASIDELYRLGCAAVKYGASRLVLTIPYFGYSTMERATKPGEVVSAKTVARQLSAIPHAPSGNWVVLMDTTSRATRSPPSCTPSRRSSRRSSRCSCPNSASRRRTWAGPSGSRRSRITSTPRWR
jgi:phosphoribosylpyrophosphate synthetase